MPRLSTATPDSRAAAGQLAERALEYARRVHSGDRGEVEGGAYVKHPIEVADLLRGAGVADRVIAAALLHDVVEKTDVGVEEIRRRFGHEVARLVEALTEDERIDDCAERKTKHRRQVAAAGPEAAAIFIADKLAKTRELRRAAAREDGRLPPTRTPVEAKLGHYRDTLDMFGHTAPELPLLAELASELEALERERR